MAAHKIYTRPYAPFPSIFGKIDRLMREAYQGESSLGFTGKEGAFDTKEYKIQSTPEVISSDVTVQFSGRTDCLIKFEDGTKGIMDFKTSEVKEASVALYAPQLYAYRECLDPASVSRMGLLCASPVKAISHPNGNKALEMRETWIEIPIDEGYWQDFKSKLFTLLLTPFGEVQGKIGCPHCESQKRTAP